jgi:hypothetical protein
VDSVTVPALSYQLLTSYECNAQLTQTIQSQIYVTTQGQVGQFVLVSGVQDQIFIIVRQLRVS